MTLPSARQKVTPAEVAAVVERWHESWQPLPLWILARAVVVERHPLKATPIREFLGRLAAIGPAFEAEVLEAARRALAMGAIPARAIDLR